MYNDNKKKTTKEAKKQSSKIKTTKSFNGTNEQKYRFNPKTKKTTI